MTDIIFMEDVLCVAKLDQAAALLDPLRLEILKTATEPISAAGIAGRLKLPRQRVNYHVRALARAGFLKRAGRSLKRNMAEQRYQAVARSVVLLPELLGPVAPDAARMADPLSAAYLAATAAQIQSETARSAQQAAMEGKRLSTLTLDAGVRFRSPEQRSEFTQRLEQALVDAIAQYTSPDGSPFRLVLACYPAPARERDVAENPMLLS